MSDMASSTWIVDWGWSLPLILITVIVHVFGLAAIHDAVVAILQEKAILRRFIFKFVRTMSAALLLIILLHGIEAAGWALTYRALGLFPDNKAAMLYSLSTMTGFGVPTVSLPPDWEMMGALQSMAGLLLFGLTTAFQFAMIQAVWPSEQQGLFSSRPAVKLDQQSAPVRNGSTAAER